MKKILLLGGSEQQIAAIKKAKELGYYTILCDYLPDNPGQHFADKFYLKSTTDKRKILKIAKKEKVDGIVAYASDPAAPTAAYVAEKLGLYTNPYNSVKILCNKDLFRSFLKKNNFNTPKFKSYRSINAAIKDINSGYFNLPVILKPVDSSGSKGVCLIDDKLKVNSEIFKNALNFSRKNKFIIEEFVNISGYQVAGDGLAINGKLVFRLFGNDQFDSKSANPFVPVAASFPSIFSTQIQDKIHLEIQRLITLLNIKNCTFNFDIRIDKNNNVYLMEIAPRDGGNYIPQIINQMTGVDLVEYSIKIAMGEKLYMPVLKNLNKYMCYYSVHSYKTGILDGIEIDGNIKPHIVETHFTKAKGDKITDYRGANSTLGIILLKFDDLQQMLEAIQNNSFLKILTK